MFAVRPDHEGVCELLRRGLESVCILLEDVYMVIAVAELIRKGVRDRFYESTRNPADGVALGTYGGPPSLVIVSYHNM